MANNPKLLVIHHPAMNQRDIDKYPGKKIVDLFRSWHVNGNGWSDVGYHYIINNDGSGNFKVYDGRPDSIPGAHAFGFNQNSLGINVCYGLNTEPPEKALNALAQLLYTLCKHYNIPIARSHIKGHRELMGTECPGANLYKNLDRVVNLAKTINKQPAKLPDQTAKTPVKKDSQFDHINIELPNNTNMNGVLLSGSTHIGLRGINEILKSLGYEEIEIKYEPATEKEKHKVVIKRSNGVSHNEVN